MGFKTPKKALSTEGLAPWAQNERLRSQKTHFLQNFALLRPKRVLGAFCRFGRKKSENRSWAISGSKNVPRCLCFTLFGARGEKDDFLLKSCCLKKKKNKKLFLAQHKNMKSSQKMKKVIFTHFRQKRKTLYKRNVLGTLFRPESQKRDFFTFGTKK